MYAHCYRSGEIKLSTRRDLDGMIMFSQGSKAELTAKLNARARLTYDGKTWLVPGAPEAETDDLALQALFDFEDRMKVSLKTKGKR